MSSRTANRWLSLATGIAALGAVGGDPEQPPSFSRHVRPILAENCLQCHGPDVQESGVRLDTREGLFADLGGAAVVTPGDPEASELFYRVTAEEDDRMPPSDHAERLGEAEVATLRRWIEAGATWEAHWAFEPFRPVDVPDVTSSWSRNDIDRFVLARLASEELTREELAPSPLADRRTLARRLSLDLIGLPPSPAELAAFERDEREGAIERYVDSLLSKEQFGEHFGRRWLDLARYADSHGFTIDGGRSMWPYRDWVVQALNADMPFDRFTIEQLAGDLLPQPTRAQRIATGFHRNTQINQEGGAKDEENRVHAVVDRTNTTAAVWLGVTMECAQCHDHKFDPVSQVEYYRMFAFFDQTADGGVRGGPSMQVPKDAAGEEALARHEARGVAAAEALAAAREQASIGWSTWVPETHTAENGSELVLQEDGSLVAVGQNPETSVYDLRGPLPPALCAVRLEALPALGLPAHGPGRAKGGAFVLSDLVLSLRDATTQAWVPLSDVTNCTASYEAPTEKGAGPAAAAFDGDDETGWSVSDRSGEPHVLTAKVALPTSELSAFDALRVELRQTHGAQHVLGHFRLQFATDSHAQLPVEPGDAWRAAWNAVALHARARPSLPSTLVMRERHVPRVTQLFHRGSHLDRRQAVTPGLPAAIDTFAHEPASNRLHLARWLVHPENALAHRVTVSRIWQELFGVGLVSTQSDFGLRGAPPSHPDLLEHLAQRFVADGFSIKRLVRAIVTSSTYLQSSAPRPELDERDPENRLLARQTRLRLPAETIRDSALVASGLLSPTLGGPPVQPPQPEGVYAFTQSKKGWTTSEGSDRYRRTLYTRLWRSSVYPFLTTFDFPSAAVTCTRRLRSQTPLQALTLANDPMILELAQGVAARVTREVQDDGERIERAFLVTLGRTSTASEREVVEAHLAAERGAERDEDAVWTSLARLLLNLEEFSTRP